MKPYLLGEMNSIQPIHTGRSARFLKKPENKIIGSSIRGTTADIDLASKIILPSSKPKEDPLIPINAMIR
jgi:hypothetical protein